jgi:hypothetical protein
LQGANQSPDKYRKGPGPFIYTTGPIFLFDLI